MNQRLRQRYYKRSAEMDTSLKEVDRQMVEGATRIALLILNSIKDAGDEGLPSGHLYISLASKGCSLSRYEGMVSSLHNTGMVMKSSDERLVITDAGKKGIERLQAALAVSSL